MKNKLLFLSLGMIIGAWGQSALFPDVAQAGELCNYRNQLLYVSAAYTNKDEVWVSKGWWVVEPGECMSYPDNWYTYVEVNKGETVERQELTAEEGVEMVKLCAVQDRYTLYNSISAEVCDRTDYGFSENSLQTFYAIGPKREIIK